MEMREPPNDFTDAICLDPRYVGDHKFCAEIDSWYDQFQNALQDSEMVLKFDTPPPSNISCNVGIAHYALGDEALAARSSTPATRKIPISRRVGTTKPKCGRCSLCGSREGVGGEEYQSDAREKTPLDREREYQ